MKTSFKLLALVFAASFPCAAFAGMVTTHVTASLGIDSLIGLFAVSALGIVAASDYARRASSRSFALAYRKATTESHRLAA